MGDPDADAPAARPSDRRPPDEDVVAFLRSFHDAEPTGLEVLGGGYWSAAYGYRVGDDELVLRVNDAPDGFRSDEAAVRYRSPGLPVPEVLAIGEAFGRWYAVSRRHHGRFLESIGPAEAAALGPTVVALLGALRAVPDTGGAATPWRAWLLEALADRPDRHDTGWRAKVAADPPTDRAFREAERRIHALLDACPDRRELVHGDLLHFNVLVAPAADAVTAVFSWKCSTWGDALYDLAWCTFWGRRWHEGIGALDLYRHVAPTAGPDAAARHHAYELHVGAAHLGWFATLGDTDNLRLTCDVLDELLERGPERDVPVAG